MVGRKSNNAEQRPSLGTAILRMLSSNVFHKKPEYPIHCTSAVWCPHDLDTTTDFIVAAGVVAFVLVFMGITTEGKALWLLPLMAVVVLQAVGLTPCAPYVWQGCDWVGGTSRAGLRSKKP